MDKKTIKAFDFDVFDLSDDYFNNPKKLKKIEKHNTSREELVNYQKDLFLSDVNRTKDDILNKKDLYTHFPLNVDYAIRFIYCPDENFLVNLVDVLDLMLKEENKKYLDYQILYDPSDMIGGGIHSEILSSLVADNKYLERCIWEEKIHGDNFIVTPNNRFTGLLPYLYRHGYKELYERVFQFCLCILKNYSHRTGLMVLSLNNFLKANDKEKFEVFEKVFNEIREQDKTVWDIPLSRGEYGYGFFAKKPYWDTPFMDVLE